MSVSVRCMRLVASSQPSPKGKDAFSPPFREGLGVGLTYLICKCYLTSFPISHPQPTDKDSLTKSGQLPGISLQLKVANELVQINIFVYKVLKRHCAIRSIYL